MFFPLVAFFFFFGFTPLISSFFLFHKVEGRVLAFRLLFGEDLVKHDGSRRGGAYSGGMVVLVVFSDVSGCRWQLLSMTSCLDTWQMLVHQRGRVAGCFCLGDMGIKGNPKHQEA